MPGASTAEDLEFCRGLVFAPHGKGKTRLLATANDDDRTYPICILDFEGGTRSIVGSGVIVRRVRDWQDYNEAYAYASSDANEYRAYGIDSISETQTFGLLNILDIDKKRPDPDSLSEADWGVILIQMRRFIRKWRDLDVHLFVTALSTEEVMPGIGRVTVPLLQGKFAKDLPGLMDVVGYLDNAEQSDDQGAWTQRTLFLRPEAYPKFRVKARSPIDVDVPSELVDPTIGGLLDALGYPSKSAA